MGKGILSSTPCMPNVHALLIIFRVHVIFTTLQFSNTLYSSMYGWHVANTLYSSMYGWHVANALQQTLYFEDALNMSRPCTNFTTAEAAGRITRCSIPRPHPAPPPYKEVSLACICCHLWVCGRDSWGKRCMPPPLHAPVCLRPFLYVSALYCKSG